MPSVTVDVANLPLADRDFPQHRHWDWRSDYDYRTEPVEDCRTYATYDLSDEMLKFLERELPICHP